MCVMDTGQEGRALILDGSSELVFPLHFPFAQSSSKPTACAQRRTCGLRGAQTLPVHHHLRKILTPDESITSSRTRSGDRPAGVGLLPLTLDFHPFDQTSYMKTRETSWWSTG